MALQESKLILMM
jgi:hypothetical protein